MSEFLFDPKVPVDDETLTGVLFLHARAVEECLRLADRHAGGSHTAVEVLRVAAILMTVPEHIETGWRGYRWSLPATIGPKTAGKDSSVMRGAVTSAIPEATVAAPI